MPYKNLEQKRERSRVWGIIYRKTHAAQIKNRNRIWYLNNKEYVRIKSRKYFHDNKKKISKAHSEYNKINRIALNAARRRLYKKHMIESPDKHAMKRRMLVKSRRVLLRMILQDMACASCNSTNYKTFQWAHLHGTNKVDNISSMVMRHSWQKILVEMHKCVVLCQPCHVKYDRGSK